MNNFSIKDIERLSGIKAHTLRIWEQRHGLSFCKRKESLHRYYDNEDLKQILRIAYLYHNGYKISQIATFSEDEIKKLAVTRLGENNYDIFVNQMIEASMDYDEVRFEKVVHTASLHLGIERSVTKVFYPFMEKIGLLWMAEHVIPAQEHFSSYLILRKILVAIDAVKPAHINGNLVVLIFSPEGELHELPLLFMQYLLKKHGIKTVFFGVNTTLPKLEYYCAHKTVTHLYFHLITNFLHKDPEEYLSCLAKKFPGVIIIASGPALVNVQSSLPQVHVLASMEEILELPKSF